MSKTNDTAATRVLTDSELDTVAGGEVSLTEAMCAYMHAIFNPPPPPPPPPPQR